MRVSRFLVAIAHKVPQADGAAPWKAEEGNGINHVKTLSAGTGIAEFLGHKRKAEVESREQRLGRERSRDGKQDGEAKTCPRPQ